MEVIFTEALRVKASTLVSNHIFEVILPTSGTLLNSKTVDVEKVTKGVASVGVLVVKLTLAPGLRSCEYNRLLVDYHSFRKASDQAEPHYDQLVRPLILEDIVNQFELIDTSYYS